MGNDSQEFSEAFVFLSEVKFLDVSEDELAHR